MNKFYITTPIFYPTGLPHIGTAYNIFIADALAKYYRQKLGKENVLFLTGTDEHGANIEKKANELGKTPKEYVDEYAKAFDELWKKLDLDYNFFMRTTFSEHEKFAQQLIQKSFDNGDIYEGKYEGLYCESCEAYYTEKDLVDGKCPNHPLKTPIFTSEKNYYFKLSKYQDFLLKYLEEHPDFIRPSKWYEYIKGLISQGLEDIPITRANVKWGIPVPFDPEQTIYVWYDALPNYLSYLNFEENKSKNYYENFWPVAHHLVGKDILRFHAILWPAMLQSAGYPLPKSIITHGFFTVEGKKIGKSNGNAINPTDLSKIYGIDAIRYALMSEFQLGNDGDFNIARLEAKYTGDLANNFGNLLNRIIHLAQTKDIDLNDSTKVTDEFKKQVDEIRQRYISHFENFEIYEAAQLCNELSLLGNKYVDTQKPWDKSKTDEEVALTIINLGYLLNTLVDMFYPLIPDTAVKAKELLQKREKGILFPKLSEIKPGEPEVNIEDLLKRIKIVKITEINKHPNADRLSIVKVDLGNGNLKDVITGAPNVRVGMYVPFIGLGEIIPGAYIFDKKIIKLEKKNLRGIDSDSMVMSADEFGLSQDHSGLYELIGNDSLIGKNLLECLSAEDLEKIEMNSKK